MIDCNPCMNKRFTKITRALALLLPVVCLLLLLSLTAFAKNTYLINDGGRVTVHTTYATDPADVLHEDREHCIRQKDDDGFLLRRDR